MASYGEGGYGGQKHQGTDSYGNPVRQTDEYGNPIHQTTGGTMGDYGSGGLTGAGATGAHGVGLSTGTGATTGVTQHRRSGSSSSSSSEDDGEGGRRKKKSIKDKIKEKLPGGHKQEEQYGTTAPVTGGSYGTATGGGYGTGEQHHTGTGGGYGTGEQHHTGTGGGYGTTATGEQPHEKKGIMEKIKDKLPGGHNN